jgi:hypothetical protein
MSVNIMKRLLLITFFLLFGNVSVPACVCSDNGPSVCESYGNAHSVFIGSVRAVERVKKMDDLFHEVVDSQRADVQVERVFKGNLPAKVVLRTHGSDCDPEYKEGERWLFFAYHSKTAGIWEIAYCDRSTLVEHANDDLLYLKGLPKSASRTRIAGTIKHYEDDPEEGFKLIGGIAGLKVSIVGADKTYEVYTDMNGVYEMYGLAPGKYSIRPEIPLGLKLHFPMPNGPITYVDKTQWQLDLHEKSCGGSDFVLMSDTSIKGKVYGADGKPLPDVCLELRPAYRKAGPYFRVSDCTDHKGSYKLDDMPPGNYVIVINPDGKMGSADPVPRTIYYPGTFEWDKASIIRIVAGSHLQNYDIHIPAQ